MYAQTKTLEIKAWFEADLVCQWARPRANTVLVLWSTQIINAWNSVPFSEVTALL